jgi:hypothetical protein
MDWHIFNIHPRVGFFYRQLLSLFKNKGLAGRFFVLVFFRSLYKFAHYGRGCLDRKSLDIDEFCPLFSCKVQQVENGPIYGTSAQVTCQI